MMSMKQVIDAQVDAKTKSVLVSVQKDQIEEKKLGEMLKAKGFELKSVKKITTLAVAASMTIMAAVMRVMMAMASALEYDLNIPLMVIPARMAPRA